MYAIQILDKLHSLGSWKKQSYKWFIGIYGLLLSGFQCNAVGREAIEGLRFLASLPLAGTGREKMQPFNWLHSRLFTRRIPTRITAWNWVEKCTPTRCICSRFNYEIPFQIWTFRPSRVVIAVDIPYLMRPWTVRVSANRVQKKRRVMADDFIDTNTKRTNGRGSFNPL